MGLTFTPHNSQDLLWFFLTIASADMVILNTMADFYCNKADLLYWPFDGDWGATSIKRGREKDSEQTSYCPSFGKRFVSKE